MKKLLSLFLVFTVYLGLASCAGVTDEDSYVFDDFDEFEEIDSFIFRNNLSWQFLDSRSLIVDIRPTQAYLLILNRNLTSIGFADDVRISSSGNRIRAGVDSVSAPSQGSASALIERIYILPDREARSEARDIIRGS